MSASGKYRHSPKLGRWQVLGQSRQLPLPDAAILERPLIQQLVCSVAEFAVSTEVEPALQAMRRWAV